MLTSQISDLKSRLLLANHAKTFRLIGTINSYRVPGVRFSADGKEAESFNFCSKNVANTVAESRSLLLDFLLLIEEKYFRNLEDFVVDCCAIGPEEALAISRLIQKAKMLKKFRLTNVDIENNELERISKAVISSNTLILLGFSCYTSLLREVNVYPSNAELMFSEIVRKSKSISSIIWEVDQRRQIPRCMFDSYCSSAITSLDLSFSFILDIAGLCRVISTNPSLISLELAALQFDDLDAPGAILNAIQSSSLETLQFAMIPLRDLDVEMFEQMLFNSSSLTDLTFGPEDNETPIGPLLIDKVFKVLPKTQNIRKVYLMGSGCQITPEHITGVLQLDHLEDFTFSDVILPDECSDRFLSVVDRIMTIKDLSFASSSWKDETKLAEVIKMMNPSSSLTSLNIGKVSAPTASIVLQELKTNTNLVEFHLQNTHFKSNFRREVIVSLIDLLKTNRALQNIYAGTYQQEVFDSFLPELEETLRNNSSIMVLGIQPYNFSKETLNRNKNEFLMGKKLSLLQAFKQYSSMELDKYVFKLIFALMK
jgi:hypothetical protein